jgi:putative ABC transport system permease protein
VVAGAAVPQYMEITADNIDSFHFHGRPDQFPLTAVIAIPCDEKSGTLLSGRYASALATAQILAPTEVIDELLQVVFKIKRFFDLAALVIGGVTGTFLVLVVWLSVRLRRREMETMFKIGCSRWTLCWLLATEFSLVLTMAVVTAAVLAFGTVLYAPSLLREWSFLA